MRYLISWYVCLAHVEKHHHFFSMRENKIGPFTEWIRVYGYIFCEHMSGKQTRNLKMQTWVVKVPHRSFFALIRSVCLEQLFFRLFERRRRRRTRKFLKRWKRRRHCRHRSRRRQWCFNHGISYGVSLLNIHVDAGASIPYKVAPKASRNTHIKVLCVCEYIVSSSLTLSLSLTLTIQYPCYKLGLSFSLFAFVSLACHEIEGERVLQGVSHPYPAPPLLPPMSETLKKDEKLFLSLGSSSFFLSFHLSK